jgi:hypothetical protein
MQTTNTTQPALNINGATRQQLLQWRRDYYKRAMASGVSMYVTPVADDWAIVADLDRRLAALR